MKVLYRRLICVTKDDVLVMVKDEGDDEIKIEEVLYRLLIWIRQLGIRGSQRSMRSHF